MQSLAHIAPKTPVLIAGPTASGKSSLALKIARNDGGVVINADAIQVYANWRVLTARPSEAEEAQAEHRLYGHIAGDADYSVGHWLREVAPLINSGARPIIVGGTGLYFMALTQGLAEIPPTPSDVRALADSRLASEGLATLLSEVDDESRARIDQQNPMRVQRAWEVLKATGRGIAQWQDETPPPLLPLEQTHPIVFESDTEWLNNRIAQRFDVMLEQGALDEAQANLTTWDPTLLSNRAIGAPELISYLKSERTLEQARDAATVATRQFAKRQRTWFRSKMKNWHKFDPSQDI
ncbi:MAG: tRNA (adenosine(37)-N6)-dimethylallyltransferase MiaA [Thalassovita sp.]